MYNNFVKATLVSPKLEVGNPKFNIDEILSTLKNISSDIIAFPELAITSYSCEDLFLTEELLNDNNDALNKLIKENPSKALIIVGGIFSYDSVLFNVAYVIKEHKLLGIVPKYYLANYNEYSESRWFGSALNSKRITNVDFLGFNVPFGDVLFKCKNSEYNLEVGIEICEDAWAPISPTNIMSLNNANVFFNISASDEFLNKDKKRINMVTDQSRKNRGAYLYVSASSSESSTGQVQGSSQIASVYGETLFENQKLSFDTKINEVFIDLSYISNIRKKDSSFKESLDEYNKKYQVVEFSLEEKKEDLGLNPYPFRIDSIDDIDRLFEIQSFGLIKRLKHINQNKMILGVSGGLDSTIALLTLYETCKRFNLDPKESIIPVFLPYRNSSNRTKTNASLMCEYLGLNPMIIPINKQVDALLESIEHETKDVTYENAQVRVRTSILMELANKYNGIMIGTSDLSEIAMGYSTYNGDSMSMYNMNSSLSKTFIQTFITEYANRLDDIKLKNVLLDIVDTPISAELNVNQFTENEIGKYIYIDFILYRFVKCGDTKERIKSLLVDTFKLSLEEATLIIDKFFKRFYGQQYKRNASPDSLKTTSFSLDPHYDFRMVSDVKRK